jgi:hypothetical protein
LTRFLLQDKDMILFLKRTKSKIQYRKGSQPPIANESLDSCPFVFFCSTFSFPYLFRILISSFVQKTFKFCLFRFLSPTFTLHHHTHITFLIPPKNSSHFFQSPKCRLPFYLSPLLSLSTNLNPLSLHLFLPLSILLLLSHHHGNYHLFLLILQN